MTSFKLKYVHAYTDRTGKARFYFNRRRWPKVALPGLPGSPEFLAAYEKALAGASPDGAPEHQEKAIIPGTMDDLITRYYASPRFQGLKQVSRDTYRRRMEAFRLDHGRKSIAGLEARHIENIIAAKGGSSGAARNVVRMLHMLMSYAVKQRDRRDNPCDAVDVPQAGPGYHTWDEDEIKQYESAWPVGSKERLAFALHLFTGQRRADVVRMTWRDIKDGLLTVRQQKTGVTLRIPVHPELQSCLDATPRIHISILTAGDKKPYTVDGYGHWMHKAIVMADLPMECSTHGLRKAAGRRLAECGCTTHEIASILGHKTLGEIERYTRAAEQTRLASAAIMKLRDAR